MDTLSRDETWLLREKYHGVRGAEFNHDRARLSSGEPLAYVIGSVPFLNIIVYLDSRPLIPRPETEHWANLVIEHFKESTDLRVLDLCSGSGCLGVAIAKNVPGAIVDCVEIDERHHETVRKNAHENGVSAERIRVLGGDLFERVSSLYDLIVSNPPYIGTDAITAVDASVLEHEPHGALFAGTDGFLYLRRIITEAPSHLTERGELYLEHEPRHQDAIAALSRSCGYRAAESIQDQYGIVRVTHLTL